MTRIELAHVVAADASSVALVLAGPAARELWPRRDDESPAYEIRLAPPRRAGIGFSARAALVAAEEKVGAGRLTIVPVTGREGSCDVRLSLTGPDGSGAVLRQAAGEYLQNVSDVSRARSTAA